MRNGFLLLLSFLLTWNFGYAQQRTCASHDIHNAMLASNPEYAANRAAIEAQIDRYVQHPVKQRGIKTIPVVVHVIYRTANENISDAQIMSQIDILNKDFRKLNTDWTNTPAPFINSVADCGFQFCLAQVDPNGNPTTGIIRVPTTVTSFTADDKVKFTAQGGDDAWDRNKYLNIWVCNMAGYLGYASFPGSPANVDGIVVQHSAFGSGGNTVWPYNLGRTATHEIGHWMNLFHIWGDDGTGCLGSDRVDDTPNQAGYNTTCQTFPKVSCNNGPNGDMFMNFMDYTPDACMYMFTNGQKLRMDATFAFGGPRWNLLTSNVCNANSCGMPDSLYATNINYNSATVGWQANPNVENYIFQYKKVGDTAWVTQNTTANSYTFSNLPELTSYEFRVLAECFVGTSIFTNPFIFTTTAIPLPCNAPTSLSAAVSSFSTATITWQPPQYATSYIVRYKATTNINWIVDSVTGTTDNLIDLMPTTTYEYQIQTVCANGFSIWSELGNFTTPAIPIPCSNSFEPNNNRNGAASLTLNTTIGSMITSNNDRDYYTITTTSAEPKLKVTLSSLPMDYDVRLLTTNGSQLAISQNAGLVTDEIRYNASAPATYIIYIYPAQSGQFSTVNCYNLSTSTSSSNWRIDEAYPTSGKTEMDDRLVISNDKLINYSAEANDDVTITLYSTMGQRIHSIQLKAINSGSNTYFLPDLSLSSGLYLVEVLTNSDKQTGKIIIR
ncbi:MAG: fibronectin type III domain-containing protein [Chitinophagaceae bacterium]